MLLSSKRYEIKIDLWYLYRYSSRQLIYVVLVVLCFLVDKLSLLSSLCIAIIK
jgi:hypothetical protein